VPPRIAIPMPHSTDREYGERAIPQYERAVELAGGVPVRIALDQTAAEVIKIVAQCDGVLLPGSNADVDPARFHARNSPRTAAADPRREAVDDLLLQDAYERRKPVLGICYGLQSLNVYLRGSLIQHIPDFLPQETRAKVNHEAGKKVAVAHTVEIEEDSRLARIVADESRGFRNGGGTATSTSGAKARSDDRAPIRSAQSAAPPKVSASLEAEARVDAKVPWAVLEALRHPNGDRLESDRPKSDRLKSQSGSRLVVPVNSSHHQSADVIGDGLRIVARCPDDGIIEALEGTAPDHFVLAVQWHPERSVDEDEPSRAIFRALIEGATLHETLR